MAAASPHARTELPTVQEYLDRAAHAPAPRTLIDVLEETAAALLTRGW